MTSNISITQTNASYHIYPIGQQREEEENQFLALQNNHQEPTFPKYKSSLKPRLSHSIDHQKKSINLHNNQRCKTLGKDQEEYIKREVLVIKPNQVLLPHLIHHRKNPSLRKNAKQRHHPKSNLQTAIKKESGGFFGGLSSMKNSRQLKPKRIINIGSLNCSHIFLSQLHSQAPLDTSHPSISRKQLKKLVTISKLNPNPKNQLPTKAHSLSLKKQ